jgi:hypothetical protein
MLKLKTGLHVGKFLLGTLLVAGLAGPAFAGNVYSWVTDDGTHAFTDDPKRIPAKHRVQAKKKTMGRLTRYERFTEVSSEVDKPYAERIRERRTALREVTSPAPIGAVTGTLQPPSTSLVYSTAVSGGNGQGNQSGAFVNVPIGSQASSGSEQTTIESIRVRTPKSLASRHITVIKQGDRPVTVIKGELRQRPLDGPPESDFDL